MINYYCPDFHAGRNIYKKLVLLKNKHSEVFNENVNIKVAFGSFPGMIWNGGGVNMNYFVTMSEVANIINEYKSLDISLQLTCTNPLIEEKHLNDIYCNKILDIWSQSENSVLVSSPILEAYLREKYPYLKIDRSVVNTHHDYDWEKALDSGYNNIVMPRRHSRNFDCLTSIDNQYRNRIEIICNDKCPINCKRIDFHYNDFAKYTLFEDDQNLNLECTNLERKKAPFNNCKKDEISYNEIITNFLPLNYTEFKLTGRGHPIAIVSSIVPYLFKQEYWIDAMVFLLRD